jgi:hypothetical protein
VGDGAVGDDYCAGFDEGVPAGEHG